MRRAEAAEAQTGRRRCNGWRPRLRESDQPCLALSMVERAASIMATGSSLSESRY